MIVTDRVGIWPESRILESDQMIYGPDRVDGQQFVRGPFLTHF